jgi:site-specific recombinase XerC
MTSMTLPALIQRFFTDRLCVQMEASHHTIASYRDTFRLLLRYAGSRLGKRPVAITVEDIDVDLVADFLVHTETRGATAHAAVTPGSPRSVRSSATWRWPIQHGCCTASASSPCPTSAMLSAPSRS